MADKKTQNNNQNPIPFTVNLGNSNKGFWIFIILLFAIIGGILWWFGIWQQSLVVVLSIAFILYMLYQLIDGIKKGNVIKIFLILGLGLWLLDLSNYLGPPYAGFEFNPKGFLKTNWIGLVSSAFFMGIMMLGMFMDIAKKNIRRFLLTFSLIMLILQLSSRRLLGGLSEIQIDYLNWVFLGLLIIVLAVAFYKRESVSEDIGSLASYIFMVLVFSYFWLNWAGWSWNFKAILHVIYILAFGFFVIYPNEDSPSAWHIIIPCLLIADFYGYGFLYWTGILALKFISPLLLFVIVYSYVKTKEPFAMVAFMLMVLVFLILAYEASGYSIEVEQLQGRQGQGQLSGFSSYIGEKMKLIWSGVEGGLDKGSGGYYSEVFKSSVEKNQYEPLGVYFDTVRAAQPRFYSDEDVTLWATIKSRTLNDPVVVNFTCSRWENGVRKATAKDDKIYPENPFTVYTLEETDVECTFTQDSQKSKLSAGSNILTLSATYNFETSAYQKLYFIDRERLRAMTRENIDPYNEFGIDDKEPRTIHTNGPVELALKMQYLTPVSDESTIQPNLGILVQNRNTITDKSGQPVGKWEGKVRKINDLVLILPFGMTLEADGCKPAKFTSITDTAQYCSNSCISLCKNTCIEYSDPKKTDCEKDCNSQLGEVAKKCGTECRQIFQADDPSKPYNSYSMDTAGLNQLRNQDNALEYRNFDRHKTFGCRVRITSDVLENVPITTKFIRSVVRYDYTVDESYTVSVEKAPDVLITQSSRQSVDSALKELEEEETLQIGGQTPTATILGLVYYESRFMHCCAESGRNRGWNCKPTDEATCPSDRLLTSHDRSSVGIMQINKVNWGLVSEVCASGQTINDRECNIEVGFEILRGDLRRYGNGASDSVLARYCPPGEPYHEKYKAYRGLDAVLRAYNGWGCKMSVLRSRCQEACSSGRANCVENCALGAVNYVENVKALGEKVQSGQLQIPDVPEFDEMIKSHDFEDG